MSKARNLARLIVDSGGDVDSSALNAVPFITGRNRIINGDMRIDQRNAGASVTAGNASYFIDRWRTEVSGGGAYTVQQVTTAPAGFQNSALVTVTTADASIAAGDYYDVQQFIEGFNVADLGWGTANAQAVTLSFWVRSSVTGTFAGSLMNSAGNRAYVFTYTVNAANTFEYKTVTIPGDTTGTWLTNNGRGITLSFDLGNGSSYQAAAGSWVGQYAIGTSTSVKLIATSGATFYITGVQLEAGSVATPFERRPYGTELQLCQRYFEKSYNIDVAPGTASTSYSAFSSSGSAGGLTTAYLDSWLPFKVTKRATPTMAAWDEANNSGNSTRVNPGVLATSGQNIGFQSAGMNNVTGSSVTGANAGRFSFNWTASAEL